MATAADRVHVATKQPAAFLALFLLFAGAVAWSQNGVPVVVLNWSLRPAECRAAPEERPKSLSVQNLLPDAPSAVVATPRERFPVWGEKVTIISNGTATNVRMTTQLPAHLAYGEAPGSSTSHRTPVFHNRSIFFGGESLEPTLARRYRPSTSDSFLRRAGDSASRLFFTRDDFGKRKINTLYLLGVLASAAVAGNTHLSYRRHTASATFGDFWSVIGSDAGKNILRQFWPRMHQVLGGRTSKAWQGREEGLARDPISATRGLAWVR